MERRAAASAALRAGGPVRAAEAGVAQAHAAPEMMFSRTKTRATWAPRSTAVGEYRGNGTARRWYRRGGHPTPTEPPQSPAGRFVGVPTPAVGCRGGHHSHRPHRAVRRGRGSAPTWRSRSPGSSSFCWSRPCPPCSWPSGAPVVEPDGAHAPRRGPGGRRGERLQHGRRPRHRPGDAPHPAPSARHRRGHPRRRLRFRLDPRSGRLRRALVGG